MEHGHQAAISIHNYCQSVPVTARPAYGMNLISQKMGISEWSYHNDYNPAHRQKMQHVDLVQRFEDLNIEVELGFSAEQTAREVQRCLNCDVETVFTAAKCIECDACIDICPLSCLTIAPDAPEDVLRHHLSAPAVNADQALYASKPLPQTGRLMLKDEDLCVHCGLCAERCPTAAWDMQKFQLFISYAGSESAHNIMRSRVNDFAIKLANVNGTGSASANSLIMQAIFRMGVPVSGKNLFPSNIQGLPTWYEIRVNRDGYTARALDYDLMVAMNSQTYRRDVNELRPGGYLLYDSSWPLDPELHRDDIEYVGVPLARMCNETFKEPRERILMKNIATAGALIELLNIDGAVVQQLVEEKYGRKKALRESNQKALKLGADYVKEHFTCPLPFHLEQMDANDDKILIDGNTATALGCVYAGATVAAWYPITPATSVMDTFQGILRRIPQRQGNRRK